jgi:hypothetical protein
MNLYGEQMQNETDREMNPHYSSLMNSIFMGKWSLMTYGSHGRSTLRNTQWLEPQIQWDIIIFPHENCNKLGHTSLRPVYLIISGQTHRS